MKEIGANYINFRSAKIIDR